MFNKSIKIYSKALKESGFTVELKYLPNEVQELRNNNRRKRRRKIIWFNPPYSKNVRTNVGKVFLQLLKKHFSTSHILHRIFNKDIVKNSYSCIKNINSVIPFHSKNILNPRTTLLGCNCREKESCLLNGECLTSQLVYRATITITVNKDIKKCIGLANITFKERQSNHKKDFKHQKYRNCTELAKYVWELKEKNIVPIIKCKILSKVYGNPKQNMCILCLTEKLWIINFIHDNNYLNKKSELINKCRHFNKFLLRNVK